MRRFASRLGRASLGLGVFVFISGVALAQPGFVPPPPPPVFTPPPPPNPQQTNQAMMHTAQAHASAQQAMNHSMQMHYHNQRVMETARQHQNYGSGGNGGGNAGGGFHAGANGWTNGGGAGVWQPGERFTSHDLALQYERLSAVDYHSLSPVERGQYKAACRKFRLAMRHGYVYR